MTTPDAKFPGQAETGWGTRTVWTGADNYLAPNRDSTAQVELSAARDKKPTESLKKDKSSDRNMSKHQLTNKTLFFLQHDFCTISYS